MRTTHESDPGPSSGGHEPEDADPGSPAPAPSSRRPALWLSVALFAAGLLAGVVLVGLLNASTPDFAPQAPGGSAVPGGATPTPQPNGAAAQAQVNAACLAVINDAQDVYVSLGDLAPALDRKDLTALDDIVRRLQPVEPRLATDLGHCKVHTDVASGPSNGQTPSIAPPATPTNIPSPSPTQTR